MIELPENVKRLCESFNKKGGHAYIVGGYVRDYLFDTPSKDIDIEVFYLEPEDIEATIGPYGPSMIGKLYGVYDFKVDEYQVQVSIPRSDYSRNTVIMNPNSSVIEAASRRDYTINQLMFSTRDNKITDCFNGLLDIKLRMLHHTSDERFIDDPLRVLRGMSLASRRNLEMYPSTVKLCQKMMYMYHNISPNRLWEEWFKWSKGTNPEKGLHILFLTSWIHFYPELSMMLTTPQNPKFHPEGDVWTHTNYVVKEAAGLEPKIVFAALLHDSGKAATTRHGNEITSHDHSIVGEVLTKNFMDNIIAPFEFRNSVAELVRYHMRKKDDEISVRKLKAELKYNSIPELVQLMICDRNGRPPIERVSINDFQQMLYYDTISDIRPLVTGDHLIQMGYKPGPQFKEILNYVYKLQLENTQMTLSEGLDHVKQHFQDS